MYKSVNLRGGNICKKGRKQLGRSFRKENKSKLKLKLNKTMGFFDSRKKYKNIKS